MGVPIPIEAFFNKNSSMDSVYGTFAARVQIELDSLYLRMQYTVNIIPHEIRSKVRREQKIVHSIDR